MSSLPSTTSKTRVHRISPIALYSHQTGSSALCYAINHRLDIINGIRRIFDDVDTSRPLAKCDSLQQSALVLVERNALWECLDVFVLLHMEFVVCVGLSIYHVYSIYTSEYILCLSLLLIRWKCGNVSRRKWIWKMIVCLLDAVGPQFGDHLQINQGCPNYMYIQIYKSCFIYTLGDNWIRDFASKTFISIIQWDILKYGWN